MNSISLPDSVSIPLHEGGPSLRLNLIRRGSFLMGARGYFSVEEPVHEVSIPFDFYLGIYPVTQRQYSIWARLNDIKVDWFHTVGDFHPAYSVDWFSANQFCQWLDARWRKTNEEQNNAQIQDGLHVNLPTEAQWEYACSAWIWNEGECIDSRIYTDYHAGDAATALSQAGWYGLSSDGKTHDVGQKLPNRHGLYDMHGNVGELCRDDWGADSYRYSPDGAANPVWKNKVKNSSGPAHVLRGGSCLASATDCRAASRRLLQPRSRPGFNGFRVGLFPG